MNLIYPKEVTAASHWGYKIVTFLDLFQSEVDEDHFEIHERTMMDTPGEICREMIARRKVATIDKFGIVLHLKDLDLNFLSITLRRVGPRAPWTSELATQFCNFCLEVCPEFEKIVLDNAPSEKDMHILLTVAEDKVNWAAMEYFALLNKLWESGKMVYLSDTYDEYVKNKTR